MGTTTLDRKHPHVLRTPAQYRTAVSEIDRLLDLDPKRGTPEFDRLELLSLLVQAYEDEHVPEPDAPTPQDAVDFALEQRGLTRAALTEHMGGRSRVSDFFAGKRALSTAQIKTLRKLLKLPADLLIA